MLGNRILQAWGARRGGWNHAAPQCCVVCRDWTREAVCPACLERFAPARARCAGCALPLPGTLTRCGRCVLTPFAFASCIAAMDYVPPWDALLRRFKFQGDTGLVRALGPALGAAVRRAAQPWPDALVPVPLSAARWRERGYNQAALLARGLGADLRLDVLEGVAQRHAHTAHQRGLSAARRAANVRGAFMVAPGHAAARLAGRHLAVVDDVMTTGATADALARTLLDAGAASVQVWVAARTP